MVREKEEIICYHGTDTKAAQSILETGFRPGSWFALHLEDALACGGLHIFEVVFEFEKITPEPTWQFFTHIIIPIKQIIRYSVFSQQIIYKRIDNGS